MKKRRGNREPGAATDFNLFGIRFVASSAKAFARRLVRLRRGRSRVLCVGNVHTAVSRFWDKGLKRAQDRADFNVPDGRPLAWAARLLGHAGAGQIRGITLAREAARQGVARGTVHYFFGGAPGVAQEAARALVRSNPRMKVAGWESPPFRPLTLAEEAALARKMRRLRVDLLWVGLGAPKQEKWMDRMRGKIPCTLLGIGAAFDFLAGSRPEAPGWMQRAGLEWFFRLCSEPRRLWKRYLVTNPVFILLFIAQVLGLWKNTLSIPGRKAWSKRRS